MNFLSCQRIVQNEYIGNTHLFPARRFFLLTVGECAKERAKMLDYSRPMFHALFKRKLAHRTAFPCSKYGAIRKTGNNRQLARIVRRHKQTPHTGSYVCTSSMRSFPFPKRAARNVVTES